MFFFTCSITLSPCDIRHWFYKDLDYFHNMFKNFYAKTVLND